MFSWGEESFFINFHCAYNIVKALEHRKIKTPLLPDFSLRFLFLISYIMSSQNVNCRRDRHFVCLIHFLEQCLAIVNLFNKYSSDNYVLDTFLGI